MTVYISPNPGKEQAVATAQQAAQLLLMQGATVLMRDDLNETCCAAWSNAWHATAPSIRWPKSPRSVWCR